MSLSITTDVFCDVCCDWVNGLTTASYGNVAGKARATAYQGGWRRVKIKGKLRDLCPKCMDKPISELEAQLSE